MRDAHRFLRTGTHGAPYLDLIVAIVTETESIHVKFRERIMDRILDGNAQYHYKSNQW